MVNYGNGKIYKIVRLSDDVVVYVGSTTKQYLSSRLVEHKNMSKYKPNRRVYKSISENGGWENHEIVLIEPCICNSRDELHKKEREFVVFLKPIGNFQIPARTKLEYSKVYYYENKMRENEKSMKYYYQNKDRILLQMSKVIQCLCGKTYTHQHRVRHLNSPTHMNSIPVQFKQITKMHNELHNKLQNRPPIPDLSNL